MVEKANQQTIMLKILLTGSNGQLGQKIVKEFKDQFELIKTDRHNLDITNKKLVAQYVTEIRPDYIIHAAAYTDVDKAETDRSTCKKINIDGTQNLALVAGALAIPIIYISTDYVFSGRKKKPYIERDPTSPVCYYGKTKLLGERAIVAHCKKHYIIRVSWLFGESTIGKNFVETIINLSRKNKSIKVVDDQIGSPTYTGDVAKIIKELIKKMPRYGIYHFSGKGITSKYQQAKQIVEYFDTNTAVLPCKSSVFPTPAKRPHYSYLSKDKIERALSIKARAWEKMQEEYFKKRPTTR